MEMTSSLTNYAPKKNKSLLHQIDDSSLISIDSDVCKVEIDQNDSLISSQDSCLVKSILLHHSPLNE